MDHNWLHSWKETTNALQPVSDEEMLGGLFSEVPPQHTNMTPLPPQSVEGSTQNPGQTEKVKKSGTKPKQPNFSPNEDKTLVSCWLNVSTDAVVGTGQRKASFWRIIEQSYNMNKGSAYTTRSLRSLEGRWDFIKEQVTKFAAYHQQVLMDNRSGHSDADKTAAAVTLYNSLEARAFVVPHCWEILKNEAKWLDLQEDRPMAGGAADADQVAAQMQEASNSVHQETEESSPASQSHKRPLGRDSTKAARKRSATESGSSSHYESVMSDMCMKKMNFWKESDGEVNERLDKLVAIEERKVICEEKRLGLKERFESECLALKRAQEDERIMAIYLDKCNPAQRQMYERMQQAILARWSSIS